MNKKTISTLKYTLVFFLGFITDFSGFLDNITNIPSSYKEFKKVYLYDSELLSGTWSNNAEYVINSEELNLDYDQPLITMSLHVDEHDGAITGEILSKRICDTLPLTWIISMESPEPNLGLFFIDRRFYLKQLKSGKMETVATLKLTKKEKNKIILERVEDQWTILPKQVVLVKIHPYYHTDFEELSKYCAQSPERFRQKIRKMRENKSSKISS